MKKQTFNLHTHTWRCGHASGQDQEYIEKAIAAGFEIIGFSEHIQYRADNGKYGRINFEDYIYYFSNIGDLKEKYKDKILILCGLEAAYVPEAMEDLLELKEKSDFILLGQHQGGLSNKKYCLKCNDEDVLQYATDIEDGLNTNLYSVVAHPDFFMNSRDTWSKQCDEATHRICIAAKSHNIPLELNIKGSLEKKTWIEGSLCVHYPFRKFWEIASEIGNEVIYGWDAHSPQDLLLPTIAVDEIIKDLNLNWCHNLNTNLLK